MLFNAAFILHYIVFFIIFATEYNEIKIIEYQTIIKYQT